MTNEHLVNAIGLQDKGQIGTTRQERNGRRGDTSGWSGHGKAWRLRGRSKNIVGGKGNDDVPQIGQASRMDLVPNLQRWHVDE